MTSRAYLAILTAFALITACGDDSTAATETSAGTTDAASSSAGATGGGSSNGTAGEGGAETGDGSTDSGGPVVPCSPDAPFDATMAVAGLGTAQFEQSATLTMDERTLYYAATIEGQAPVVMTAERGSRHDAFSPPQIAFGENFGGLSNAFEVGMSADGRTLAVMQFDLGVQLWLSRRTRPEAPWPVPQEVPFANAVRAPHPSPDGARLYWHSRDRFVPDEMDNQELWLSAVDDWPGQPVALDELNTFADESDPVVSTDELHLFWSSERTDLEGQGADIYSASRGSIDEPFSGIHRLAELSTPADETPDWISEDLCRLYFTRHEGDPIDGSATLMVAARAP